MQRLLWCLLSCALSFSLIACTSMQPIDTPYDHTVPSEVRAGKDVEILLKTGQTFEVHVTRIASAGVEGRIIDGGDKALLFRYDAIQQINERKFSAARTGLLVGGIVVGIVTIYAILIKSIASRL